MVLKLARAKGNQDEIWGGKKIVACLGYQQARWKHTRQLRKAEIWLEIYFRGVTCDTGREEEQRQRDKKYFGVTFAEANQRAR